MGKKRVALLVGKGSRVPAMLECEDNLKDIEIVLVLSCTGEGVGTETAYKYGVDAEVVNWDDYKKFRDDRFKFDTLVLWTLAAHKVDFVIMAGWRVLMPRRFTKRYGGRTINIHPSCLPKYPGNGEKAIEGQWKNRHTDKKAGCTLHYVDEGMDSGKIILQYSLDPRECKSQEELAQRIHRKEDLLLCEGLELIAEGKI